MKAALSILALASLVACGGGGGGGGGGGFAPIAAAPATPSAPVEPAPHVVVEEPLKTPIIIDPNCKRTAGSNRIDCDLMPSEQDIGIYVPVGDFATFTNRTGQHLQINEADAYTGERQFWSEWCVYLDDGITGQRKPGVGEVGCSTKGVGEDYPPIHFGEGTGLIVPPGSVVTVHSNTQPAPMPHIYSLKVSLQVSGLNSWCQPRMDKTFYCNEQLQSTEWEPWKNETGQDIHMVGALIYAETPSSMTPHKLSGSACIYVFGADGQTLKYENCNDDFTARGNVSFPLVTVKPGEFIVSQATNACKTGSNWDWVAFLRVW